jgi:hypothetical protein
MCTNGGGKTLLQRPLIPDGALYVQDKVRFTSYTGEAETKLKGID